MSHVENGESEPALMFTVHIGVNRFTGVKNSELLLDLWQSNQQILYGYKERGKGLTMLLL